MSVKKYLTLDGLTYFLNKIKSTVADELDGKANDSDVVHKSGNETIIGSKRFGVVQSFTGYPSIRLYSTSDDINVSPSYPQQLDIRFTDKNNNIISYFIFQHRTDINEPFRTCWRQVKMDGTNGYYSINFNNLGVFYPENNNAIDLGGQGNRWKSVYAMNYYYGPNNIEFSTKFVTTDTAQTISESKTFTNTIKIKKEIELNGSRLAYILPEFSAGYSGLSLCTYSSSSAVRLGTWKVDDNDNTKHVLDASLGYLNVTTGAVNSVNIVYLTPRNASKAKLGDSTNKWDEINGVEPSSLSLPSDNVSDFIDISSYFSNTGSGGTNNYTALANGWIYLRLGDITSCQVVLNDSSNRRLWGTSATGNVEQIIMPILKDTTLTTTWVTNSTVNVATARFIPCQGNV